MAAPIRRLVSSALCKLAARSRDAAAVNARAEWVASTVP
jgi:hypothetical protein